MIRTEAYKKHTYLPSPLALRPVVVDLGLNADWFALAMIGNRNARLFGAEPEPAIIATVPRHPRLIADQVAITGGQESIRLFVNNNKAASIITGLAQAGTDMNDDLLAEPKGCLPDHRALPIVSPIPPWSAEPGSPDADTPIAGIPR